MIRDDAIRCAERLIDSFNGVAEEQARYWRNQCEKHDDWKPAQFERAIEKMMEKTRFCENDTLHQIMLRVVADDLARAATERQLSERAKRRQEEERVDAHWREVDAYIATLSDDEFKAAASEALEMSLLEPAAREILGKLANPRNSRTLKGLIYNHRKPSAIVS